MPRGDGTGPWGLGPMTGRGLGYCAGFPVPGYLNPGPGFGARWWGWPGRGRGRGMGWWRYGRAPWVAAPVAWPYATPGAVAYPFYYGGAAGTEEEALRREAETLKEEKEAIQDRLDEIESYLRARRSKASEEEGNDSPDKDGDER